MNNPETDLHNRIKGIQFSQSIPVRDPHTREMEKKPIKPFMVNQTSIILERDQLILNPDDKTIWKQMEDYQVVRKTISGQPVYTSENEHALDALMLAVMGFSLEFPNIAKILQEMVVARKIALAPKLKHLQNKVITGSSRDSEPEQELWDPTDPEERRGHLIRRSNNKSPSAQKKARQTATWGPRGSSIAKEPKRRSW